MKFMTRDFISNITRMKKELPFRFRNTSGILSLRYIAFLALFNLACLISFAQYPPPTVTNLVPASGPVGTTVKIVGTYFTGNVASTIVFFGGAKATVSTVSQNTVTVTVPAGAAYDYVTVTDISYPATAYSPKPFNLTFPCGGLIDPASFAAKADYTAGSGPSGIAVGDLNGDGKPDIVTCNQSSNTISVFRNTSVSGAISFAAALTYTTGAYPQHVTLGDLNVDGKLDIVTANYTPSSVSVFRNTSTSSISFAAKVDFTVGSHPFGVAVNDLDADGYPEIVTANRDGNSASILRNTGSITFAAKVDLTTGAGPHSVAIGDIDGDGKPDIATSNGTDNSISVLRHTGAAGSLTFAANVDFSAGGTAPRHMAIGDLDLDGKADFVTGNANSVPGAISVIKNTSTAGTISCATAVSYTTAATYAVTSGVTIGDIDGDGFPDIAAANAHTAVNKISVFKNSGTGTFAARTDFATATAPEGIGIADLDGDGKPDLSSANNSAASISTLRNLINVIPAMTNGNTATICSGDTVNLALIGNVPATYVWKASDNVNTSGESLTNQTNDTLSDIIVNNTLSVQTITYTVTPTGIQGCVGIAQTITVTVNPLPVANFIGLAGNSCINGSVQALTGSPAGGTFSGAGISSSNFTPSAAGSGTHTVTYTYTDGNGCTNKSNQTTQVTTLPLPPAICLVTVDSVTYAKNMLVWEKPVTTAIDSFRIYRNISSVMVRIGSQSYSVISTFVDTTPGVSPKTQAHEYAISLVDTCGNESALGPTHITIHQLAPVFSLPHQYDLVWSDYQGFPFADYEIWRDSTDKDKWQKIGLVPYTLSTTYTDLNAPTDSVRYRISAVPAQPCDATIKNPDVLATTVKSAKSNSSEKTLPVSVFETSADSRMSVSPNPSNGTFTVQMDNEQWLMVNENTSNINHQPLIIAIYNLLGEKMFSKYVSTMKTDVNVSELLNGVYQLQVTTNSGIVNRKIAISR